ncbi:hypothetical protein SUGI_0286170 [Cryptomeria japonica]|uniref:probable protein phosphatase 2C 25 isoform X1 n=1 Tax=Cryptomeria japonica TaxID=3369 RepID=UPI002408D940|nr:probable protein phosphatase 2C 25 isoform X1 [Cryptomeria japonica]GLJ16670.1 hypothetical protein SUGI_0286170 [Cryptomeria japonica]
MPLSGPPCSFTSDGSSSCPLNSVRWDLQSSPVRDEEQQRCDNCEGVMNCCVEGNVLRWPLSQLKRKRPPRLEIPSAGPLLHIENLSEELQKEMYVQGSNYSVACKKGYRQVMEDAYSAITDISRYSDQAFFGVFDGHGGHKAADFAAERLGQNMMDAFMEVRQDDNDMEQAVRTGYLTTDAIFSMQCLSSGACCVTALIRGGNMVVANAGDCRAVLSRDGIAEALTYDHRLEREDERQRITDLGGYVDCHNGVWRVQGKLAVSRSIGDIEMKKWVTAEPELHKLSITSNCEFLILASDGLWDKVGNQEAVDLARDFYTENSTSFSSIRESLIMGSCKKLVEVAVNRGSKDDVTVLIVDLTQFRRERD